MADYFDTLLNTNIFKGISRDTLEELMRNKPYRIRKYRRDEYIAVSHEECRDMLIVVEGTVRGEMTDFSGKKLKIEDIPAPRPLAAAFLFGRENRFPVDVIANEQATILVIPRDVLIYLFQHSQIILQNYLNVISSRTQFLSNKIRFLSFKTIKGKIANYILKHTAQNSRTLLLNQSQTELAELFGVTRPSLARALAELEAEGILQVDRREIIIQDKEKLNKLLNQ